MNTATHQRSAGFTLIELTVTVAVLGVLLSVAAPSFRDLQAAQRVRSAANSLVSDLVLARSEALKRGRNVVLTAADSGWTGGWTMGVQDTDSILGQQNALGQNVQVSVSPSTLTRVVFDRSGRISNATSLRFEMTGASNSKRCVWLDLSGRPKSTTSACPS